MVRSARLYWWMSAATCGAVVDSGFISMSMVALGKRWKTDSSVGIPKSAALWAPGGSGLSPVRTPR